MQQMKSTPQETRWAPAERQPLVSIVLPVRNEAAFIERNLMALAAQTYPLDRLEVLVVDGQSDDGTQERVRAFAAAQQGCDVRLLDNPQRIMPAGFNLGLAASHGEVVIVVGGHCTLAPDYVARCVETLRQTGADCVGGLIETVGETVEAQAIAAAQSSPFGVGGATFRMADAQPGYVDTVAFGAYRRDVFARIGGLDEELVRNQDDEFNFRLTQAGGKIWLDPAIRATYYSRSSLRKLWTQYYDYGLYKVRVIQKRGAVPSWRHLAPGSFVLAAAVGIGLFATTRRKLFLAPVVAYTATNLAFALATGLARPPQGKRAQGLGILPYLPWAFAILHFAYGLGFLAGLWRWRRYGLPSLRVAPWTT
jgi:GT2 family glycosyltransferase